ncbi:MAG: AAA family ATPase [Candidatus Helarchaeota archaeon]
MSNNNVELLKIEFQNIKTFTNQTITFSSGRNVFCGKNGVGKSTIFQAIGFILFGYLPVSQKELIRKFSKSRENKPKTGIITLWIRAKDGREYVIERGIPSRYYRLIDAESKVRIYEKNEDIKEWIKDNILNKKIKIKLEEIFKNIIGVEQGEWVAPFKLTPTVRKKYFDPILRVEEYQKAYKELADSVSLSKDNFENKEKEKALNERDIKDYKLLVSELDKIEKNIIFLKERLEKKIQISKNIDNELAELEDIERKFNILLRNKEIIIQKYHDTQANLKVIKLNFEESKIAKKIIKETNASRIEYERKQEELKVLNKEYEAKNKLEDEIKSINENIMKIRGELKNISEKLEEIKEAEQKIKQLLPKKKQQEELEKKIKELELVEAALKSEKKEMKKNKQRLKIIEEKIEKINLNLLNYDEYNKVAKSLPEIEAQYRNYQTELTKLDSKLKNLKKSSKNLADGICPYFHEPCPIIEGGIDPKKFFQDQIEEIKSEKKMTQTKFEETKIKYKQAQSITQKVIELNSQKEILFDMKSERDKIQQDLDTRKAYLEENESKLKILPSLKGKLISLGNPEQKYYNYQQKIEKKPQILKRQKELLSELKIFESKISEINQHLESYGDIENKIKEVNSKIDALFPKYKLYQKHLADYEKFEKRKEDLTNIQKEIEFLTQQKIKIEEKFNNISQKYDEDAIKTARKVSESTKMEISSIKAKINEKTQQSKKLIEKIKEMDLKKEKIKSIEKELNELKTLNKRIKFTRETIKKAGPLITNEYLKSINLLANNIFHEIIDSTKIDLHWNIDYGITFKIKTEEKSLLSGGELMAAAISIRLALLLDMSPTNFIFLDEPTPNLDSEKRENLAKYLSRIKQKQIFITSQDDTFDGIAEHIIRLEKNDEISKLTSNEQKPIQKTLDLGL